MINKWRRTREGEKTEKRRRREGKEKEKRSPGGEALWRSTGEPGEEKRREEKRREFLPSVRS